MKKKTGKIIPFIFNVLTILLLTVITVFATVFLSLKLITSDISVSAKELFVTTILETGQMKFLASWFLSEDEIQKVLDNNQMKDFNEEEDLDMIDINKDNINDIELVNISGNTFAAKILIIKDPSRVKLSTIYPWKEYGMLLHELVEKSDAIAGINGGLYESDKNKGGRPVGVVVSDSIIQFNKPGLKGLYLIGFDENNMLRIIDLEGMNANNVEKLIKDEKIRDAVTFQDQMTVDNNHFVKLVVNGKAREFEGKGSGANPRTVIGQRKDGSVLFLVADGRGKSGHLGATASDLIKIMMKYDALNAANLDGGSSTSMYYNGKYEMTSVTLYYDNTSWNLPTSFVVEKR